MSEVHETSPERSTRPAAGRPTSRRRAIASALVIVLAMLFVPLSIVGGWARVQLVDEDAFVATLAPLAQSPAVQGYVADQATQALRSQVDIEGLTEAVFDGIARLGLPPRAEAALDLLRQPAAHGVASLVESGLASAVESQTFADAWTGAMRGAHRALSLAATADGNGVIVVTEGKFGLALEPLIAGLKHELAEQGVGIAVLIPTIDRTLILGDAHVLVTYRTGSALVTALGWWLPVVTFALFGGGIALSRRRSVAVVGSGICLALGAGALVVAFSIGSLVILAGSLDSAGAVVAAIYTQLVTQMNATAWLLVWTGAAIAVGGWLAGPSRAARRIRSAVRSAGTR